MASDCAAQAVTHRVQGIRIDQIHFFGQRNFRRQVERFGSECRVFGRISEHAGKGGEETIRNLQGAAGLHRLDAIEDQVGGKALAGLPAVEGVAVMRHQLRELFFRVGIFDDHRCRKAAQDGGHG